MPSIGPYTLVAFVECLASIVCFAVAFATKGWLTGTFFSLNGKWGDVEVGLFKTSVDGKEYDTKYFTGVDADMVKATIIIEAVGGGLMLITIICLLVGFFTKQRSPSRFPWLIIAYTVGALISGIVLIIGPAVLNGSNYSIFLDVDYSWYFALASGLLILTNIGSMGYALRRGEWDGTSATNVERI